MNPSVSIVTATHRRSDVLLGRCIPSVQAQTYSPVEHLVVIDGPDPALVWQLERFGYRAAADHRRRLVELGRNWGMVGNAARAVGAFLAAGDWICYLDDDNEFDPDHVETMVAQALAKQVGLVCCAWRTPTGEVAGWAPPGTNRTDAGSILHHRDLLRISAWQPGDGYAADGALVDRWLAAGVRWSFLDRPTMTYHPADPTAYAAWLAGMAAQHV